MDSIATMTLKVAQWTLGKLLNSASSNLIDAWAVRKELGDDVLKLKHELRFVQAQLENVEGVGINEKPELAAVLQELRDAAEDADNLVDELDYFRIRDEVEGTQEAADEIRESFFHRTFNAATDAFKLTARQYCCTCAGGALPNSECDEKNGTSTDTATPLRLEFDRVNMARRLREVTLQLKNIREDASCVLPKLIPPPTTRSARVPTTHLPLPSVKVFGRDNQRNEVVSMLKQLVNSDLAPVVFVLPIVGQGGLGKTTFARYVYNDEQLAEIFPTKMWVCVSLGGFNPQTLTTKILEQSGDREGSKSTDLECLQNLLLKRINDNGKRFFLVLDDMWQCKKDEWDLFLAPLVQSKVNGNVILVTTRFPNTVEIVKTKEDFGKKIENYNFRGLEQSALWNYFNFCIFGVENREINDVSMDVVAKDIFSKLGGNPLAAKTIGGLLGSDINIKHWTNILKSQSWTQAKDDSDIMPVLKLSYDYLIFPINRCFLYCCLFPEDYKFDSRELIRFWVGMECIRPVEGKSIEQTGYEYLELLVGLGLIEQSCNEYERKAYFLHDLFHDLARDVSRAECFIFDGLEKQVDPNFKTIRHLSILINSKIFQLDKHEKEFEERLSAFQIEKLHTVLLIGHYDFSPCFTICRKVFREASNIRVFGHIGRWKYDDFQEASFPLPLSKLHHLRYLRANCNYLGVNIFPELFHLKVYEAKSKLLGNLSKNVNLRHAVLTSPSEYSYKIDNVGNLVHLQQLQCFCVGRDDAFKLNQLGKLKELRGSLGIKNLQNVEKADEATNAKLKGKELDALSLSWDGPSTLQHEVVIEELKPYRFLKELEIELFLGENLPTWLNGECYFRCLEELTLVKCRNLKNLPFIGKLTSLKGLVISELDSISELRFCAPNENQESTAWCLENLVVKNMPQLTYIEMDASLFPCLRIVQISGCPALQDLPLLPSLKTCRFDQLDFLIIVDCEKLETPFPPLPPHPSTLRMCEIRNVMSSPYSSFLYDLFESRLSLCGNYRMKLIDNWSTILAFENLKGVKSVKISGLLPQSWSGFEERPMAEELKISHCGFDGISDVQELLNSEAPPTTLQIPFLPSLQEISIVKSPNLVFHCPLVSLCFGSLERIKIEDCPNFSFKNVELRMMDFGEGASSSSRLSDLVLEDCEGLEIPSEIFYCFSSLTYLYICGCSSFVASWRAAAHVVETMKCLQRLVTDDVGVLEPALCRHLSSSLRMLRFLFLQSQIEMLSMEQEEALSLLTSLEELSFWYCNHLRSLPKELHHLPSLVALSLMSCPQLQTLPPTGLPRLLRRLFVSDCPQLQSLPPTGLPESLQHLNVKDCNKALEDECAAWNQRMSSRTEECSSHQILHPIDRGTAAFHSNTK